MAATVAAQAGASVALVERSDRAGGRLGLQVQSLQGPRSIYRGHSGVAFCRGLLNDFDAAGGYLLLNATVSAVEPPSRESGALLLTYSAPRGPTATKARSVVLATGSVEPAASFPGADLGGIVLSNDVQRMVNVEGRLPGRRVLMVGSDNAGLLIAVGLIQAGAEVVAVVDEAPAVVGREVNVAPLRARGVEFLTSTRVLAALGSATVSSAIVADVSGQERALRVDTVCLSPPRVPDSQLALQAGCSVHGVDVLGGPVPVHRRDMGTAVPGLYVCGDVAGVENGAVALECGRLAGLSAAGRLGFSHPDAVALERLARARLGYLRRSRRGLARRQAKAELGARLKLLGAAWGAEHGRVRARRSD